MLLRAAVVPPDDAVEELWTATRALRTVPGVTAVARERLDLPITSFGNLLPPDCVRLARLLRSSFEGAEAPRLWFDGFRIEDGGEVVVGLSGDVEPIADLARFVPEAAERLRLYVDRRRFRPVISFATVAPTPSPALLDAALASVADWAGSPWPVPGLSLLRTRWHNGVDWPEQFDMIELA
ncbi:hypothetical protein D0Z08_07520 [Nocardioides immobilis]|uniref:2'-5' RNA ligase family protein n=1 Tax=Nocardioides immobilis TaxID=2049295 RepID=A0A417Y4G2_9ACTN|nr:hypothetical protein [Nocardioides immobilis]RHW27529.1 hypothetical protein D0Z08_07520 [Nocardioides immobilis]